MTFDPRTVVAAVQQAGEAVYGALDVVRRAREAQQAALLDGLQTNPFHPAAESAFQDLKTLSRLALQLDQVEQELRGHFAAAGTLGNGHGGQLLDAAAPPARAPLALTAPDAAAHRPRAGPPRARPGSSTDPGTTRAGCWTSSRPGSKPDRPAPHRCRARPSPVAPTSRSDRSASRCAGCWTAASCASPSPAASNSPEVPARRRRPSLLRRCAPPRPAASAPAGARCSRSAPAR